MRFNDAILGLVIMLGGLAIILEARNFKPTHGQAFGPDLFPTMIGVGFVLAGLGLVWSGWRSRRETGWFSRGAIARGHLLDAGLILFGIAAFIAVADRLGFLLTGGAFCWVVMGRLRGGAWLSSLAISAVIVLAVDWTFRSMLLVPLPTGILPLLPW